VTTNSRSGAPTTQSSEHHEHGAEVVLFLDECQHEQRDRQQRYQNPAVTVECAQFVFAREQVGAPHDQPQLGEFRRLNGEGATEGDPTRCAVRRDAKARDEDSNQQPARGKKRRIGKEAKNLNRQPASNQH
jgi:hypothetical protein